MCLKWDDENCTPRSFPVINYLTNLTLFLSDRIVVDFAYESFPASVLESADIKSALKTNLYKFNLQLMWTRPYNLTDSFLFSFNIDLNRK